MRIHWFQIVNIRTVGVGLLHLLTIGAVCPLVDDRRRGYGYAMPQSKNRSLSRALWVASEIRATAECLVRAQYRCVREMGLSRREWHVIVMVAESSCRLSVSDLGRRLLITRQAARRLADRLARRELIEQPNSRDRRLLQIELTVRAASLIGQVRERFGERAAGFAAILDERRAATLVKAPQDIRATFG